MGDRKTKYVEPEVYRGPCGIARESLWLTQEDLPHDKDTVVTIEKIHIRRNVEFTNETKKVAESAKFKGKERELLLNATHRNTLTRLSGSSNCGAWFGLTIALFVDPEVKSFGKIVPAVRIRAKRVQQPQNGAGSTQATPPGQDTTQYEIADPGASQDEAGNTGSDGGS